LDQYGFDKDGVYKKGKGHTKSKWFFKPIILPKKRTFEFEFNYYDTSG
jgi:hypothetical protein